jgi:hypothetical protein
MLPLKITISANLRKEAINARSIKAAADPELGPKAEPHVIFYELYISSEGGDSFFAHAEWGRAHWYVRNEITKNVSNPVDFLDQRVRLLLDNGFAFKSLAWFWRGILPGNRPHFFAAGPSAGEDRFIKISFRARNGEACVPLEFIADPTYTSYEQIQIERVGQSKGMVIRMSNEPLALPGAFSIEQVIQKMESANFRINEVVYSVRLYRPVWPPPIDTVEIISLFEATQPSQP